MAPFAIAGIQTQLAAVHDSVEGMRQRPDLRMARLPWTRMALLSGLGPHGPLTRHAHALPNHAVDPFRVDGHRHGIRLVPGSMFEKADRRTRLAEASRRVNYPLAAQR